MKFAQLVIGPAGCGKSTYCSTIQQHCQACGRAVHVLNLDPAAEEFVYQPSGDVRDLISVDDAMEELDYGPNGALLYCMEYLEEHVHDWLSEELEGFGEDDYLLLDCPGQIELFTHIPVLRTLIDFMRNDGWNVCAVYCLDSHFITDSSKFIAGCFQAMSAMVTLEVPHLNVLTKVDLMPDKEELEDIVHPDKHALLASLAGSTAPRFRALNHAVAKLVDDYGMVSFTPIDISDEDSIAAALLQIDTAIQYGEDQEVATKDFGEGE